MRRAAMDLARDNADVAISGKVVLSGDATRARRRSSPAS